jgi:septum formation protein
LKIILASQSPRRQELLRQMGVRFRVVTDEVAEEHGRGRAARAICKRNALAKAAVVAEKFPKQTVLGADTLVHLGDELFGKPASLAEARRMLGRLSGRTHQVTTACALVCGGRKKIFSVTTRVTFRELSARQISVYLRAVPVLDKAGAYAVQEKGEWIVEALHGSFTNVVGLPVERLRRELAAWFDTASGRP